MLGLENEKSTIQGQALFYGLFYGLMLDYFPLIF